MMEMRELVGYYMLAILVRGYNFNKTSRIVNKSGTIRNGGNRTFWNQKIAFKKSMKFICFIVYLLLKIIIKQKKSVNFIYIFSVIV